MARLVTFDVTNTCIRIVKSVGYHYSQAVQSHGIHLDPLQLDKAFNLMFKKMNREFPNFGLNQNISCHDWWEKLVSGTFAALGMTDEGIVKQIGNKLYADFAGPQKWEVYPDVVPTLHALKQKGLAVGVISNFDDRLKPILKSLKIADLFDFTLASYEVGYCKPDPRLFQLALKRAQVRADQATHVGDNYDLDYIAARAAGMQSVLLTRDGMIPDTGEPANCIKTLTELIELCSNV